MRRGSILTECSGSSATSCRRASFSRIRNRHGEFTASVAGYTEDTAFTVAASVLTGNDSDLKGDPITLVSVQGAVHGIVSLSGGNITFMPAELYRRGELHVHDPGFAGAHRHRDGVVQHLQCQRRAGARGRSCGECKRRAAASSSPRPISAKPIWSDAGAGLTYPVAPGNGQVLVNGNVATTFTAQDVIDGRVSFRHNGSETSSASFTFTLADGGENGSTPASGTFNLTVTPVNNSPVIAGDLASTVARSASLVITTGVLGEADPDDAGAELTYTVTSLTNGDVLVNGAVANAFTAQDVIDGLVHYRHERWAGPAKLGFTLADGGEDGSTPVSGRLTLAVNEPPNAVDDASVWASIPEESALAGPGRACSTTIPIRKEIRSRSFRYRTRRTGPSSCRVAVGDPAGAELFRPRELHLHDPD